MSNFDDEDLEIEAIAKCAKALSRLDNESKTRVIRYLLDKYGFIDQSYKPTVPTNQFIGAEKQLPPTNKETKVETINAEPASITKDNILSFLSCYRQFKRTLHKLMTKQYTKNETEILLMILYYKSNNGTIPIERSSIMDAYREESIYTEGRNKNLSKNIDNLIQQSYISAITKTKFIITSAGIEQIQLIATGKSEAKLRKPRNTKRKSPNNDK